MLIYNSAIDANLTTIEELVAKSEPLADFKAVRAGDVWCTGKSMFQEALGVGDMILDINAVLTREDPRPPPAYSSASPAGTAAG